MSKITSAKPKFDPKLRYQWKPTDEFTLNGLEFEYLYNAYKALYGGKTLAPFEIHSGHQILENLFLASVEQGVSIPQPTIEKPSVIERVESPTKEKIDEFLIS